MLSSTKMPEAEVSLRVAFSLIESGATSSDVSVAIDGAQIKTGTTIHFPITDFLGAEGWRIANPNNEWRGVYKHPEYGCCIVVHSSPGQGDVVAELKNGQVLRVESKKGPLVRSKSSQEYPLIREAIGQLLTVEVAGEDDVLAVAVPSSEKFEALASMWRDRPLMKKAGIHILTVNRKNEISGLSHIRI